MKRLPYLVLLVLNVLVVYSNHFRNDFQFDDVNAVPNNPAITRPSTMLRAFVDPNLFSAMPEQRNYRPVTTASLALDYWIGRGWNVFFFHLSTFLWFSVLLVLMVLLFERLMDIADPHPTNFWTAMAAATLFGFHPAGAETVNYIIQRGDLYNALGCIGGLWLFVRYPAQRRFGWYLLPALLGMLAKAPALVFPVLVLIYVLLFEEGGAPARRQWKLALVATVPALVLAGAAALLLRYMQPPAWTPGASSGSLYRLTQPFVALRYFKSFFLPTDLNIDLGWGYVAPLSLSALAGYLFVVGMLALAFAAARRRAGKPLALGIFWFFVTLLPTSLMPLADVANDHRMFFSFVGLSLAVLWTLRLMLFHYTRRLTTNNGLLNWSLVGFAVLLLAAGVATRVRNRVWLTKNSLWADSVAKNPRNFRALNNLGAIEYAEGDYSGALTNWDRALMLESVSHPLIPGNLGNAARNADRSEVAERCLRRVLELEPACARSYRWYADWLASVGRFDEAIVQLEHGRQKVPQEENFKRDRARLFAWRDAAARPQVLRALDADLDTQLSAREIIAAPGVLLTFDRNADGKLTAEESGADFGDESQMSESELREARTQFMYANPLLWAVDTNHDGEISQAEILNAEHALKGLDHDGDGVLKAPEMVPAYVNAAVSRLLQRLDLNHDGKIEVALFEDDKLREMLAAADTNGGGHVSREELTNEILYRADRNKDGRITPEEVNAVVKFYESLPLSVRHGA